ncbi:3-bisphosphoglycerate-dependent phosphoglycerate mutase [Seminavis robusta]|uniref:Phosphoglycerate mutase n=1 Tax=Seminavis robusta TaxID=568900 RepID=A0A9N8DEN3_9STRA|nr:3-bisphosphoglycerate-dependent phosphoglycerate mutase [Seminavis robusta]|eukprot:Sro120_g058660.1 3-bisphosphoglycerate-dependent phosphoglycerate mutase (403) ;mRNA; r:96231-97625
MMIAMHRGLGLFVYTSILLIPVDTATMILVRGFSPQSQFRISRGLLRRSLAVNGEQNEVNSQKKRTETSLPPVPENAHRIVLMRHGESEFNNANIFTGWCDVALTPRGRVEASEAGEVFRSHDLTFRHCYCSMLTRAIVTAQRALEAGGVSYTPISYDWRLNERHYGALQGLSKERTAERLGRERVMGWRRSYYARPPEMTEGHPHYAIINYDARYQNLGNSVPLTESLEDCQTRVIEAWKDIVQDTMQADADGASSHSLIVAHANTLRALVMHIDSIPAEEIEDLNIPTGIPFYYNLCKTTGQVLAVDDKDQGEYVKGESLGGFRGVYISDDRKKRSFLERRRAANDPWLWALHDDQVARSMLVGREEESGAKEKIEDLADMAKEALKNTELFSNVGSKDL